MSELDVAVDEYLHLLARVCPWELPREESRLRPFSTWVVERPELSSALDAIEPETALRHAREEHLSADETEDLLAALAGLYRWATRRGSASSNPFAAAHEWARAARRTLQMAGPPRLTPAGWVGS